MQKSYWFPQPTRHMVAPFSEDLSMFEEDPDDINPAIQVISLKKVCHCALQHLNIQVDYCVLKDL